MNRKFSTSASAPSVCSTVRMWRQPNLKPSPGGDGDGDGVVEAVGDAAAGVVAVAAVAAAAEVAGAAAPEAFSSSTFAVRQAYAAGID
jgi:hypothetical protein